MLPIIAMHYLWWILALLLVAFELVMPGYFMLWIGVAAAATGVLMLVVPDLSLLWQAVAFALLSLLSCLAYWRWIRPRLQRIRGEAVLLNRRGQQLVGQRFVLVEPIVNGRGKAKVGDGVWLVSGADQAAGETVMVTAVEGSTLRVRRPD